MTVGVAAAICRATACMRASGCDARTSASTAPTAATKLGRSVAKRIGPKLVPMNTL
jgi:hypothetical protein